MEDSTDVARHHTTLAAINRLFRESMTCESSSEVAQVCLAVAQDVTGSAFGSVAEINRHGRFDTLALSNPGWEHCRIAAVDPASCLQNMEIRGFWRAGLNNERGIIINDPANHPASVGVPVGHPPLNSFLGVPFRHKKFNGMIGIANKPGGYSETDRELILGLTSAFAEVINSKRGEEEIRELEGRYRAVVQDLPVLVCRNLPDGTILFVNDAYCQYFGKTREQLVGHDFYDLIPEEERETVRENLSRLTAANPVMVHEHRAYAADGTVRYHRWTNRAVCDTDGNTTLLQSSGEDITDLRRAEAERLKAQETLLEQQLRQTESVETELASVREELVRATRLAAVGQIAASIAHDLRNPLGAASNACFLLQRYRSGDLAQLDEYIDIVQQELGRAHSVIDNLLSTAKSSEPVKNAVDFGALVNQAFEDVITHGSFQLHFASERTPFTVQADRDQMRQVITNLVKNSIQAMGNQGELFVNATRAADYDIMTFRDTGSGVSPDVLDTLFEPLVTTKTKGTGLGLTICRQIIRRHGGTIEVESQKEGESTFVIRLPQE